MDDDSLHGSRSLPMFTVDSFASRPFTGNPAGVCLDSTPEGLTPETMQNIAMEMNLSETGFVRCVDEQDYGTGKRFGLRWFSPTKEVPLCGHGTMAAAAVLFSCMGNPSDTLIFDTLSGNITATREKDCITLDLPLNAPEPCKDIEQWVPLLKLITPNVDDDVQELQYSAKTKKLLVRLHDRFTRSDLESLQPQIDRFMPTRDRGDLTGIIVTLKADADRGCRSESGRSYDFISRYFGPWNGIPEDPVTGAAHTVLAGYWSPKLGKTELFARQCSRRGGDLALTLTADGRLAVAGAATVVFRGQINIL